MIKSTLAIQNAYTVIYSIPWLKCPHTRRALSGQRFWESSTACQSWVAQELLWYKSATDWHLIYTFKWIVYIHLNFLILNT